MTQCHQRLSVAVVCPRCHWGSVRAWKEERGFGQCKHGCGPVKRRPEKIPSMVGKQL